MVVVEQSWYVGLGPYLVLQTRRNDYTSFLGLSQANENTNKYSSGGSQNVGMPETYVMYVHIPSQQVQAPQAKDLGATRTKVHELDRLQFHEFQLRCIWNGDISTGGR